MKNGGVPVRYETVYQRVPNNCHIIVILSILQSYLDSFSISRSLNCPQSFPSHVEVSQNGGTPQSSISIGLSTITRPSSIINPPMYFYVMPPDWLKQLQENPINPISNGKPPLAKPPIRATMNITMKVVDLAITKC